MVSKIEPHKTKNTAEQKPPPSNRASFKNTVPMLKKHVTNRYCLKKQNRITQPLQGSVMRFLVEATRFERATSTTRMWRSTKLSHASIPTVNPTAKNKNKKTKTQNPIFRLSPSTATPRLLVIGSFCSAVNPIVSPSLSTTSPSVT